jgi:hypothetical protein
MIYRQQDLEKIDSKVQAARIAHTVGENKRLLILSEAERRSIRVLNPGPKKVEPGVTQEQTTTESKGDKEPENAVEPTPKKKTGKKTK